MLLTTSRLRLEPLQLAHSICLLSYYQRCAEHLRPWEPARPPSYFTPPVFDANVAAWVRVAQAGGAARWLIFEPTQPSICIGTANLSGIVGAPFQACTLGYGLDAAVQGKGYMREALQAVVAHAFDANGPLRMHRIMANHLPQNLRSAKTLAALGFEREGYAKNYLQIAGRWQDHVLTALTNASMPPDGCEQNG